MINPNLPAVLRRRVKEFQAAGIELERLLCLTLAADELHVRRRAAADDSNENVAVELLADNRRLRSALAELFDIVKITSVPPASKQEAMNKIRNAVLARREIGRGRKIFALEVYEETTRSEIEAAMTRHLDELYKGADHVSEIEEEDGQATGEGQGSELGGPSASDGGAAPASQDDPKTD